MIEKESGKYAHLQRGIQGKLRQAKNNWLTERCTEIEELKLTTELLQLSLLKT